jgi:hypothetical protein
VPVRGAVSTDQAQRAVSSYRLNQVVPHPP